MFYESLYRETPSCPMAIVWVVEHGVLLPVEHDRLLPAYLDAKAGRRNKKSGGTGGAAAGTTASPTRPAPPAAGKGGKSTAGKAGRGGGGGGGVVDSSAVGVDVGMSVGGSHGVGVMDF